MWDFQSYVYHWRGKDGYQAIPNLVWSDDTSVMHKTRESTRYERGLKGKRQSRKSTVRWRKRRRNIWQEEACRILKAYQTETVVCGLLTRKKRNTNSCDRTGLFFSQTVVQWSVPACDLVTHYIKDRHIGASVSRSYQRHGFIVCQNIHWTLKSIFCPQRVHT